MYLMHLHRIVTKVTQQKKRYRELAFYKIVTHNQVLQ